MPRSSEPTFEELEGNLSIDKTDLDTECAVQPEVFNRIAQRLETAISLRDEAKQALQEEEALADERARAFLDKVGTKVTEAEVKSQIVLDKKVQAGKSKLNKLNLEVGQLTALKESFKQRGYALGHLVDLYVSAYFGDTSNIERRKRATDGERAKETIAREISRRPPSRERRE